MAALFDDEGLPRTKAARAREIVERFDETRLVGQYLDLYREVLGTRG
jgi:hypothetical protein